MKTIKCKNIVKRLEALFLSVFLIISCSLSPAASVRAYAAAQAALTAWEVLQMLLLSAGVTIEFLSAGNNGELSDEDYYRLFMGHVSDQEWRDGVDSAIKDALAKGSGTAALTVSFSEDVWTAFRDWVSSLALDGTSFAIGGSSGAFYAYDTDDQGMVLCTGFIETGKYFYNYDREPDAPSDRFPCVVVNSSAGSLSFYVYDLTSKTFGLSGPVYVRTPKSGTGNVVRAGGNTIAGVLSYELNLPVFRSVDDAYAYFIDGDTSVLVNAGSESLGLISDVFYAELRDRVYDVVTPHRVLTDEGAIAGNMTLTIPKALAVPDAIAAVKEGTLPVTDVLAQVGVIPVDISKNKAIADDKTIPDALEAVESTSESWSFTAELTEIFPFCLPFDLIRFLDALDADPVAPCFGIPFVVEPLGIDIVVEMDMSFMDDAVAVFRIGELGCFIVSLILVTQRLIKW